MLTCSKHCWSQHGTTIFLFLLKRLKGLASVHHSVVNVLTCSKHCWSQHGPTIFLLFNEIEIIKLEDICLRHMWNLQTVCSHVDSRWQVFPSLYADFLTNISKAFISKRNGFFRFFIAFLKCSWNLEHSEKKEEYPSLIITEIIASERDVYLSV